MTQPAPDLTREAVELGAVDGVFFSRFFFGRTVRQPSAPFHKDCWDLLDNPAAGQAVLMLFRGASKTTLCRLHAARRIAYGWSRTIIYVGKSQDHAIRSVKWLKKQIEFNRLFAETFGLARGSKWTDEEIEIVNTVLGFTITVIAFGITGSIRGVNIDDYRPDLIIGDDLCDAENSKTSEQREKIKDLWFADLKQSLAPRSENPNSKMVLIGTMLDPGDVTSTCLNDPDWKSLKVPVLDAEGQPTWPARFPADEVERDRKAHIRLNKLSLWMREMMCVYLAPEDCVFKAEWFEPRWTPETLPKGLHYFGASDTAAKGAITADFTEHGIFGVDATGQVYVVDWWFGKRDSAEWIEQQCRMVKKWKPLAWFGETGQIRYATEPWLRKRLADLGLACRLEWLPSVTDKVNRAQGAIAMASMSRIWLPKAAPWLEHILGQWLVFPGRGAHDDAVDVLTVFVRGLDLVKLPKPKAVDEDTHPNVVQGPFGGIYGGGPQGWLAN